MKWSASLAGSFFDPPIFPAYFGDGGGEGPRIIDPTPPNAQLPAPVYPLAKDQTWSHLSVNFDVLSSFGPVTIPPGARLDIKLVTVATNGVVTPVPGAQVSLLNEVVPVGENVRFANFGPTTFMQGTLVAIEVSQQNLSGTEISFQTAVTVG